MALMIDNGEEEVTSQSGLREGGMKTRKDLSLTSARTMVKKGIKGVGAKEWSS